MSTDILNKWHSDNEEHKGVHTPDDHSRLKIENRRTNTFEYE